MLQWKLVVSPAGTGGMQNACVGKVKVLMDILLVYTTPREYIQHLLICGADGLTNSKTVNKRRTMIQFS